MIETTIDCFYWPSLTFIQYCRPIYLILIIIITTLAIQDIIPLLQALTLIAMGPLTNQYHIAIIIIIATSTTN